MKKILIILLGLFLTSLNAGVVSKTYSKTATGEGYGITYSEAVDNALAQAVTKLNGAYIKTSNSFSQTQLESSAEGTNINAVFNQKISKATNGRFGTFDVISSEQTPTGFRVVVEVKKTSTVKSYKAPGRKDNRRRMIVVPALEPNVYSIMGRDGEQVLRDLRFKIESNIHKTRKFNLLDRQAGAAQAGELELIRRDSPRDESLKIGQTLGTDYILLYSISDAETKRGKALKAIGQKGKDTLDVFVNYQVIIMATRETRFADSISVSYKVADDHASSYNAILDNIADVVISNVQLAIYPPKVEKVSNKQAIFTQHMKIGTKLDCYATGSKIVDSYTKETTGYEEIYAGEVEVVNSNSKTSYAKVLKGTIKKGNICRFKEKSQPASSQVSDEGGKEVSDVQKGTNGGFVF